MRRKRNSVDGIYLEDTEFKEFLKLCDQRKLFEAEERAELAEAQMRAALERAIAAERERDMALACARQAQRETKYAAIPAQRMAQFARTPVGFNNIKVGVNSNRSVYQKNPSLQLPLANLLQQKNAQFQSQISQLKQTPMQSYLSSLNPTARSNLLRNLRR
jgi:hypothetical protein